MVFDYHLEIVILNLCAAFLNSGECTENLFCLPLLFMKIFKELKLFIFILSHGPIEIGSIVAFFLTSEVMRTL